MTGEPRFVSLGVNQREMFALDENGDVWEYINLDSVNYWRRVPMERRDA